MRLKHSHPFKAGEVSHLSKISYVVKNSHCILALICSENSCMSGVQLYFAFYGITILFALYDSISALKVM